MKDILIGTVPIVTTHVFGHNAHVIIVRFELAATNRTVERRFTHRCSTLPTAMNAPQTDHVVPRHSARKSRSLIGLTVLTDDFAELFQEFGVMLGQNLYVPLEGIFSVSHTRNRLISCVFIDIGISRDVLSVCPRQ
jgi:hypothetical protein